MNHQATLNDVQTSTLNSRQPFGISMTPVSPCWPAKLIDPGVSTSGGAAELWTGIDQHFVWHNCRHIFH